MPSFESSRRELANAVRHLDAIKAQLKQAQRLRPEKRDADRLARLASEVQRASESVTDLTDHVRRRELADRLELMRLGWEFPSGVQTLKSTPAYERPIFRPGREASWALTLSLGIEPRASFDPEASFRPHLRKLFRNLEREVFGLSRRASESQEREAAFFFLGVYESHDKFGRPWPHIHGAIALEGHSEALLRGALRNRWGGDEEPSKRAVIALDHIAVPCPSREIAPRAVVNRPDYRPSFCLRPIYSDYWLGTYALKSAPTQNISIWTAAEILNLRKPEPALLAA